MSAVFFLGYLTGVAVTVACMAVTFGLTGTRSHERVDLWWSENPERWEWLRQRIREERHLDSDKQVDA